MGISLLSATQGITSQGVKPQEVITSQFWRLEPQDLVLTGLE